MTSQSWATAEPKADRRDSAPEIVHGVVRKALRRPGKAIDEGPRRDMERRFGFDFSRVRVHTDEVADTSAQALHARAYTVGNDIVFSAGRYAPRDTAGRRLLAHELAHTIQQGTAPPRYDDQQLSIAPRDSPVETEARCIAQAACERPTGRLAAPLITQPLVVARDPDDDPAVDPGDNPGVGTSQRGEAATIGGAEGEREEVGRVRRELEADGYDLVYSKTQMARTKGETEKGSKPRPFDNTFPDGRARPDIIAVDTKRKRILVLDLTSRPGAPAESRVRPGDLRRLPSDAPPGEGLRVHLEKTIDYADQLKRHPPAGLQVDGYTVIAQDRYWTTGKYSRQVSRGKVRLAPSAPATGGGQQSQSNDPAGSTRGAKRTNVKPKTDVDPKSTKTPATRPSGQTTQTTPTKPSATDPLKPTTQTTTTKPTVIRRSKPTTQTTSTQPATTDPAKPTTRATTTQPAKTDTPKPTTQTTTTKPPGTNVVKRPSSTPVRPTTDQPTRVAPMEPSKPPQPAKPVQAVVPESRLTELGRSGAEQLVSHIQNTLDTNLGRIHSELLAIARRSATDPEAKEAIDLLDQALTGKSLIEGFAKNPGRTAGGFIKNALINLAFDHYAQVLDREYGAFNSKYPAVTAVLQDPLGVGVSLETFQRNFLQARAAVRRPDTTKAVLYTLAALAPGAEIETAVRQANDLLAHLPNEVGAYVRSYNEAKTAYILALDFARDQLVEIRAQFLAANAVQLAKELHDRGAVLSKAGTDLDDVASDLRSNPLVWVPIVGDALWEAASDLDSLAAGFNSLGAGMDQFATDVDDREQQYAGAIKELGEQRERIANSLLLD